MHETDKERIISFIGSVNDESAKKLVEDLKNLTEEDSSKLITLYIKSEGGDPTAAFGVYEYATSILRANIQTIILGEVSSAAVLLFLMGRYRVMGRYASMCLHEFGRSWDKPIRLSCSDLQRITEETHEDQKKYAEIIEIQTEGKTSKEKALDLMKTVTRISLRDAVEFGFAHEILSKQ